jgi:glycerate kinase
LIGGELTPGAEKVLSLIGFDSSARTADCIITGEGKTDAQTAIVTEKEFGFVARLHIDISFDGG